MERLIANKGRSENPKESSYLGITVGKLLLL